MNYRVTFRLTFAALTLLTATTLATAGGPKGAPGRKPVPNPQRPTNLTKPFQPQRPQWHFGVSGNSGLNRTETVDKYESITPHKPIDKSTPVKAPQVGKPVAPLDTNLGDTGTHEVGHLRNPKGKPQGTANSWTWFSHEGNNVKSNSIPSQPGKPARPSASGIIAILIGL